MEIWFETDFDAGCWPGPLGDGQGAAAGKLWTGPRGLLNYLETQLGLSGPAVSDAFRAASLVPAVRDRTGFWSASAGVDPLGVARTLLNWRDTLIMSGWRGEGVSARLKQLAALTADVRPGVPDRLRAVIERLPRHATEIVRVHLLDQWQALPSLWRQLLDVLSESGAEVEIISLQPAPAQGDLAACREITFTPRADGSLQLLRPQGPEAAGEEVAAWLASAPWEDTLIIGGDSLLDAALRRHGLPTTGTCCDLADNSLLEILPLVLAAAWNPPDPQRALELLTLPISPIPRAIAGRLVEALRQWPAVDSDGWSAALAAGIEAFPDLETRQRLEQRLKPLLSPTVDGPEFPVEEAKHRTAVVQRWIRGHLQGEVSSCEPWEAALQQCLEFQRLVETVGLTNLTRSQLQQLVQQATSAAGHLPSLPSQAGIHRLNGPGAVAGAARQIVWWDFTRSAAGVPEALPLHFAERKALADAGIQLPDSAITAQSLSARWSRPMLCATGTLLLVCPRHGIDGEEQHPHPLWDEIIAKAPSKNVASVLICDRPKFPIQPAMQQHELLPTPSAPGSWTLPMGYVPQRRSKESPTAAAALVGCPFQWVLHYLGGIHEGHTAALPDLQALVGSVAHELLARVLKSGPLTPEQAEMMALELFDREGPRLAAQLFMPGQEPQKAQSRQTTGRAAKALFTHLKAANLQVIAVEQACNATALGSTLEGRADLIVGPPEVVIDLKSGGEPYHRDELKNGAASQLACYARLRRVNGQFPAVAFYILSSQRMLATQRIFPGVPAIAAASPQETWEGFERAYEGRWQEISLGTVTVGEHDDEGNPLPEQSLMDEQGLRLTPPCRFCHYGLLCGNQSEAR